MNVAAYGVAPFPGLRSPYQCSNPATVAPLNIDGVPVPTVVVDAPQLSAFDVVNQGLNVLLQRTGRIVASLPAVADSLCSLLVDVPEVPYTVDLFLTNELSYNDGSTGLGALEDLICGIVLENAAGYFLSIAYGFFYQSPRIDLWTNATTYDVAVLPVAPDGVTILPPGMAIRLTDDGTLKTMWMSSNGLDYSLVAAESSSVFAATKVGICFANAIGSDNPSQILTLSNFRIANEILPQFAA